MKIGHKSYPYKGFSHFGPRPVEPVVLFGSSFDGARFQAVCAIGDGSRVFAEIVRMPYLTRRPP